LRNSMAMAKKSFDPKVGWRHNTENRKVRDPKDYATNIGNKHLFGGNISLLRNGGGRRSLCKHPR